MGSKRNKKEVEYKFKIINPTPAKHKSLHASMVNVCKLLYGDKMDHESILKFKTECFRLAINNCLIDDDMEIMEHIIRRNNTAVFLPAEKETKTSARQIIEANQNNWLLIFFERDGAFNFPIAVDTSKNIIYDALGIKSGELDSPVNYYYIRRCNDGQK